MPPIEALKEIQRLTKIEIGTFYTIEGLSKLIIRANNVATTAITQIEEQAIKNI